MNPYYLVQYLAFRKYSPSTGSITNFFVDLFAMKLIATNRCNNMNESHRYDNTKTRNKR